MAEATAAVRPSHLGDCVSDLAASLRFSCGGTVVPETRSKSGIDIVFLADPDGVRVELMAGG